MGGTYIDGNVCEQHYMKTKRDSNESCKLEIKSVAKSFDYVEGDLPAVSKRDHCIDDPDIGKWVDFDGEPLYDDLCRPQAILDGPWDSNDFVQGGCPHSNKSCLNPLIN